MKRARAAGAGDGAASGTGRRAPKQHRAEPEPVVYQAARVVTRPRDAPPRPPPVAPPAPVQVVEEIAWARVVLAAACGLLCLGATCSRLCGWRRHRAVHVLSKTV